MTEGSATLRGATGGGGRERGRWGRARAEHRDTPHAAEDVRMSEAGAGSDVGHATPEGARADAAATSTRASDTLHMHSVANTA